MSAPSAPALWGLTLNPNDGLPSSFPQNGSLFKADFTLLDGIPANVIRGEQQYLAAPLVMLKMEPSGKLLPMVIQVRRPGPLPMLAFSCPRPLLPRTQPTGPGSPAPSSGSVARPHVPVLAARCLLTHPTGSTRSRVIMAFWSLVLEPVGLKLLGASDSPRGLVKTRLAGSPHHFWVRRSGVGNWELACLTSSKAMLVPRVWRSTI